MAVRGVIVGHSGNENLARSTEKEIPNPDNEADYPTYSEALCMSDFRLGEIKSRYQVRLSDGMVGCVSLEKVFEELETVVNPSGVEQAKTLVAAVVCAKSLVRESFTGSKCNFNNLLKIFKWQTNNKACVLPCNIHDQDARISNAPNIKTILDKGDVGTDKMENKYWYGVQDLASPGSLKRIGLEYEFKSIKVNQETFPEFRGCGSSDKVLRSKEKVSDGLPLWWITTDSGLVGDDCQIEFVTGPLTMQDDIYLTEVYNVMTLLSNHQVTTTSLDKLKKEINNKVSFGIEMEDGYGKLELQSYANTGITTDQANFGFVIFSPKEIFKTHFDRDLNGYVAKKWKGWFNPPASKETSFLHILQTQFNTLKGACLQGDGRNAVQHLYEKSKQFQWKHWKDNVGIYVVFFAIVHFGQACLKGGKRHDLADAKDKNGLLPKTEPKMFAHLKSLEEWCDWATLAVDTCKEIKCACQNFNYELFYYTFATMLFPAGRNQVDVHKFMRTCKKKNYDKNYEKAASSYAYVKLFQKYINTGHLNYVVIESRRECHLRNLFTDCVKNWNSPNTLKIMQKVECLKTFRDQILQYSDEDKFAQWSEGPAIMEQFVDKKRKLLDQILNLAYLAAATPTEQQSEMQALKKEKNVEMARLIAQTDEIQKKVGITDLEITINDKVEEVEKLETELKGKREKQGNELGITDLVKRKQFAQINNRVDELKELETELKLKRDQQKLALQKEMQKFQQATQVAVAKANEMMASMAISKLPTKYVPTTQLNFMSKRIKMQQKKFEKH